VVDMKNSFKIIFILVCVASFTVTFSQVNAATSWLEKAAAIFDRDTEEEHGIAVNSSVLSVSEISAAFKEALHGASENVVAQLGGTDGFNEDSNIRIPLPKKLRKVKRVLKKIGMSSYVEELELKLNRAAEVATPKAKQLFWNAIQEMTFEDVRSIYKGPDDSATRYFQEKMSGLLADEMRPIVDQSLSEVGAIQSFNSLMKKYKDVPFVSDVNIDLSEHVVEKGMEGIFYYMAVEERAIRKDPLKQSSALLKRVFGAIK